MNVLEEKTNINFYSYVDKNNIPTCEILGINIAAINMDWLIRFLETNLKNTKGNLLAGHYICVSNVHTTVLAHENLEYMEI